MDYGLRVIFGTLIAFVAYLLAKYLLAKIIGEDSEILSSGRWRYFLTQVGELVLAIILLIIAGVLFSLFSIIFGAE
jgi:hypothetical protein